MVFGSARSTELLRFYQVIKEFGGTVTKFFLTDLVKSAPPSISEAFPMPFRAKSDLLRSDYTRVGSYPVPPSSILKIMASESLQSAFHELGSDETPVGLSC